VSAIKDRFVAGASAALRGFRLATTHAEVRRTYATLALVLLVLATALDVLGVWAIWELTRPDADPSWWGTILRLLLRLGGIALVLIAAPIIALWVVNGVLPFLGQKVFLAGLRAVAPARAAELAERPGQSLGRSLADATMRMLFFVLTSLAAFLVSFVPVVGTLVAPPLEAYLGARALGWELLDPYFDKLGLRFDPQRDFIGDHRPAIVGFALPYVLLLAIPIVGPFAYGLAQAATGLFVAEVIEGDGGRAS
jgi:uncharacterized protein involved in cysteine biosynthesis